MIDQRTGIAELDDRLAEILSPGVFALLQATTRMTATDMLQALEDTEKEERMLATPYGRKLISLAFEAATALDAVGWQGTTGGFRTLCIETLEQAEACAGVETEELSILIDQLREALDRNGWGHARPALRHEMELAWSVRSAVNGILPGLTIAGAFLEDTSQPGTETAAQPQQAQDWTENWLDQSPEPQFELYDGEDGD